MIDIVHVGYPAPQGQMTLRAQSDITDFVVHHSAGAVTQTPLEVDAEHRAIGDAMIAYEWLITSDGTVYDGRPIMYVPAAAYGRNAQSVNVCVIGQFEPTAAGYTGPPTAAQLESLEALCLYAHQRFPGIVRTIGHRDVSPMFFAGDPNYSTLCPGADLYAQIPAIRQRVAAALVAGK